MESRITDSVLSLQQVQDELMLVIIVFAHNRDCTLTGILIVPGKWRIICNTEILIDFLPFSGIGSNFSQYTSTEICQQDSILRIFSYVVTHNHQGYHSSVELIIANSCLILCQSVKFPYLRGALCTSGFDEGTVDWEIPLRINFTSECCSNP